MKPHHVRARLGQESRQACGERDPATSADLRSAPGIGQHRPPGRLHEHRHEAGLDATIRMPEQATEHRVHRLGMKRREFIGRIGFESEQFPAPPRPFRAGRMVLVAAEGAGHDTTVAEPVEDRAPAMELDAAEDVRMMADHHIRPASSRPRGGRSYGQSRQRVQLCATRRSPPGLGGPQQCRSAASRQPRQQARSWRQWPPGCI
jgi:hypothetical protein